MMSYHHYMTSTAARTAALDRVLELAVLVDADMGRGLAALGLTRARTHLLWVVLQDGPSTQRHLADALGVSARNVTGLVDALVASGFVRRQPHPTDRRATLVDFTELGAATAARLQEGQQEFARLLFEDLPEEVFEGLVAGLDAVLARLRAHVQLTPEESGGSDA
jgi:DNA-binding MarR family transcriptional regulator